LRALRLAGRALRPVKHDRPVGHDGSFLINQAGEWIRFGLNKKPGAENPGRAATPIACKTISVTFR